MRRRATAITAQRGAEASHRVAYGYSGLSLFASLLASCGDSPLPTLASASRSWSAVILALPSIPASCPRSRSSWRSSRSSALPFPGLPDVGRFNPLRFPAPASANRPVPPPTPGASCRRAPARSPSRAPATGRAAASLTLVTCTANRPRTSWTSRARRIVLGPSTSARFRPIWSGLRAKRLAVAATAAFVTSSLAAPAIAGSTIAVRGARSSAYKNLRIADNATVDATGSRQVSRDNYAFVFEGGTNTALLGGYAENTLPQSTSWRTFHSTAGAIFRSPRPKLVGAHFKNYGDSVRITYAARDFLVRGNRFENMHDDAFLENDWEWGGVYEDNYADGLVGFSARPYKSDGYSDGSNRTLVIKNNILYLKPKGHVYRGRTPGNGGLFKWRDRKGRGMRVSMTGNVIRVDQEPNCGSLVFPKNGRYSGNVVVWTGKGRYPERVPAGVKVLTGKAGLDYWKARVAAWEKRH